MAVEEASRRRADGKSKTAGPRSTSVGRGNGFTPLGGSPYAFNRIAIPLALSFAGKGFHSAQAAQIRAGCLRTAALRNGFYRKGEDYDLAVAQHPLEYKKWLKAHEMCARNISSVRMTCLGYIGCVHFC